MLSINQTNNSISDKLMCQPTATRAQDDELVLENEFGQLISQLRAVLGTTKGLSSADIDIDHIRDIMESYTSNEAHWGKFALADATKGYTRNGIVDINGNANLLILVWLPGKGSAIHDHANAHCCMKILKGQLTEYLYDIPEEQQKMEPKLTTPMGRNEVGYISDKIGLHRIANETSDFAVSLHLYTPPYASLYGCSMYELNTARKHKVDMSKYHSWQGKLMNTTNASTC